MPERSRIWIRHPDLWSATCGMCRTHSGTRAFPLDTWSCCARDVVPDDEDGDKDLLKSGEVLDFQEVPINIVEPRALLFAVIYACEPSHLLFLFDSLGLVLAATKGRSESLVLLMVIA